ncbi:PAS domain-containing hybrid sensor histidine kinase/response regulator [Psychrosphaera haliotis]|uniref:histidine kinase n=1 Tax=Psychrosphaera haliotis TaxID=555083 RepID=A0A6N8F872_9GAMM|nr:PAS domain-containing hybrid sensor histidine kinase/response regulator [Psychrosphaera haliotis]MUH72736.1 response regulator [Psychrosphaera haliotis]
MTFAIFAASIVYVGIMFMLARWGDKGGALSQKVTHHPVIYSLALGIYCTSWTYFGAVGTASTQGWQFLPILLGPILLFTFGYPILAKLVTVSKKQNVTSVADFISSRYGKRQQTALIVTIIATLAIIPYIALQLKAINASFSAFSVISSIQSEQATSAFVATFVIALFSILYGARKADVTEYRSGLIFAIAFESIFKLIGLVISAVIAYMLLTDSTISNTISNTTTNTISTTLNPEIVTSQWQWSTMITTDFLVQTFMAAAAILCLPRQFHVMVVDNSDKRNLNTARWLFPLYLLLTIIAIVPIATAGNHFLADSGVSRDIFTMQLPLFAGNEWATLLVFIGGISAASAMIIVATLTLSTMITNDVFMPLVLKREQQKILAEGKYQHRIVQLRQVTIGAILFLSFAYYFVWAKETSLHNIGLIAFSLVIQLLPPILGGLYWRKGHANGVYAGLLMGFLSWLMFLLMPLASSYDAGSHSSVISQGVIISLIANSLGYYLFSIFANERLIDKIQATAFVHPNKRADLSAQKLRHTQAKVKDLNDLLMTFLGNERSEQLLLEYEQENKLTLDDNDELTHQFVNYCERMLGGVLGASSAQSLVNIVLSGKQLDVEDVVNFFDDTTQALKNNQAILFSSLENLSQGISVVDNDLNLVAWNKRYLELFDYPDHMVQVGLPIEQLIRFNAERGECGYGEVDELVSKRLSHLKSGQSHTFIRRRADGKVIEMVGNPLPNGGFVTSFNDITGFIETEKALKDANINLTDTVQRRVNEISEISVELKKAKQEADEANASKTRFLALASHDVLQPLNAARLYLSSLSEDELNQEQHGTLNKVDQSLSAMEDLLSTLLEISKLEQGALKPSFSHFKLSTVLKPLCDEISAQCADKQLEFVQHWQDVTVHSDATYLRRILQNFLSNAVKYTGSGKVLIGLRKAGQGIRIEVWDTGEGISASEHSRVFDAFYRTHTGSAKGLGLGLSVVERMSSQLKSPIKMQSTVGKGSCFGVTVPLGSESLTTQINQFEQLESSQFNQLNVICIDDEIQNLDATKTLLEKWQCQCLCFSSVEQVSDFLASCAPDSTNPSCTKPDVLLVDYQLVPSNITGLELIQSIRSHFQDAIPAALVTAMKDEELKAQCDAFGVRHMLKPLKPAPLKSWLKSLIQKAQRDAE